MRARQHQDRAERSATYWSPFVLGRAGPRSTGRGGVDRCRARRAALAAARGTGYGGWPGQSALAGRWTKGNDEPGARLTRPHRFDGLARRRCWVPAARSRQAAFRSWGADASAHAIGSWGVPRRRHRDSVACIPMPAPQMRMAASISGSALGLGWLCRSARVRRHDPRWQ